MDDLILVDLLDEVEEILPQLEAINRRLATKEDQAQLYEEFGQIVDRIFGVLGMLDLPVFTSFFGLMKEACYKCSRCDDERAYPKVMELMKALVNHLNAFKICYADPEELKTLSYKVKLDLKRAERLVTGILYSVKQGGVQASNEESNVLIFDKLDQMAMMVKEGNDIIYPTPIFFNATAGFIKKLQRKEFSIAIILIDCSVSKKIFLPLIEDCNQYRPGIPIGLLTKDPSSFGSVDLKKMNIRMVEKFPSNFRVLKSLIQKLSIKEECECSATHDGGNKIEFDAHEFLEIDAANIHLCHDNPFDLYVKINDTKLIKISNQQSCMTEEQIEIHEKKGINNYYVKKECFEKYLERCSQEVTRLLEDDQIDFGVRLSKTLSYGAQVYSYLEHAGVNKENLTEAHHFIEKSIELLEKVEIKDTEENKGMALLNHFMSDLAAQEHAVAVATFCGIFLEAIGASKKIKQDIITSAFLHDIGLYDASERIKEEDDTKLNEQEKEILYQHPARGVQILKDLGLKNILLEAIEQHHVRIGNKGYPKWEMGSSNKLNNIAEVIGISEELSRIIKTDQKEPHHNPFLMVKIEDYSPIIQRAYREVFKF